MGFNKNGLAVPLATGLLLTGCGASEAGPSDETVEQVGILAEATALVLEGKKEPDYIAKVIEGHNIPTATYTIWQEWVYEVSEQTGRTPEQVMLARANAFMEEATGASDSAEQALAQCALTILNGELDGGVGADGNVNYIGQLWLHSRRELENEPGLLEEQNRAIGALCVNMRPEFAEDGTVEAIVFDILPVDGSQE